MDAVLGDDEVDAFGGADVELPTLAHHRLGVVGPHPGGVDHLLGADLVLPARLQVLDPGADHPVALAQEPGHPRAVGRLRTVGHRRAHQRGHQAGVVHLGVVVLQRAHQRVLAQRRGDAQRLTAGQVTVQGQTAAVGPGHRHRVVERDARAGVPALPPLVLERVEERHRFDQVRGDALEEQAAFPERLAHQGEVEHLEIAQTAVDEFAGPAGGARRPVPGLDESGGQATCHGVQRGARADHTAADHQDVQFTFGHARQ